MTLLQDTVCLPPKENLLDVLVNITALHMTQSAYTGYYIWSTSLKILLISIWNPKMDWHPIQGGGGSNTPSCFMPQNPRTQVKLRSLILVIRPWVRVTHCHNYIKQKNHLIFCHLHVYHNAPCLPPKILHNHFFLISPGHCSCPRRNWGQC